VRRPFGPAQHPAAAYKLPHDIANRLASALVPFKNRDSAFELALFLSRFHSGPKRISEAFFIDRRALAAHTGLRLTEARVRGAIKALEAIGFLERAIRPAGSSHKPTEHGLHRKPIRFVFGPQYAPEFIAANARAARKAKGADPAARRPVVAPDTRRASAGFSEAISSVTKSPKGRNPSVAVVYLGEVEKKSGWRQPPLAPDPRLEGALARLEKAFRESRGREGDC
jgi:hypothetical protein